MGGGSVRLTRSCIPRKAATNLTVAVDSTATRIVFEGDKAVGIKVSTGKGPETFYGANKEIILCLGSITTPKLLQLSGIGDRSVLRPSASTPSWTARTSGVECWNTVVLQFNSDSTRTLATIGY